MAGVPLSSIRIDCRLGSVVVPSGCDDVWVYGVDGVVVWKGGTTCASSSLRANESLACGTSSPVVWKRGPLAPVVGVVGEGQVNLVYGGRVVAMMAGESLQSFVVDSFR